MKIAAGLGDFGIARYTFSATGIGTTILMMVPDSLVSGGMLANAGLPVAYGALSASIKVDATVPEPVTLFLMMIGLPMLFFGTVRQRELNPG